MTMVSQHQAPQPPLQTSGLFLRHLMEVCSKIPSHIMTYFVGPRVFLQSQLHISQKFSQIFLFYEYFDIQTAKSIVDIRVIPVSPNGSMYLVKSLHNYYDTLSGAMVFIRSHCRLVKSCQKCFFKVFFCKYSTCRHQGYSSQQKNQMLKCQWEWLPSLPHSHPLQHRHFTP